MNHKALSTLEKMRKKLRFRNYSKQTEKTYLSYAEKFLNHFDKDVYHISVKEAKDYLEKFNYSSTSQQNQIINAIKFLYREVVGRKLKTLNITRPRKERKLPKVIDKDFLVSRIKSIPNKKHKVPI